MPLQIDYSVARTWKNGFEGTISITNTGLEPVAEWQVTFDFFDVTVLTLSDAVVIAETERIYTIASLQHGPVLLPGGTATVGFTARGSAARLPLFIDDEDDEDLDDCANVVHFPGPANDLGPISAHGLDSDLLLTDGLTLDDGQVRDLLAKVDWLYFEGGAMERVRNVTGMGDRMALPHPSNENYDPLFAGSSSSSSNGSTSVPTVRPATGGSFGTATDATCHAAAGEAGRAARPAASPIGDRRERSSVTEPAPSSHLSPRSSHNDPTGLPPLPAVPPRDDWLL
ncbi:MAG: cellulose binding domain-containing protein [Rhodospirillaceae bacterium]